MAPSPPNLSATLLSKGTQNQQKIPTAPHDTNPEKNSNEMLLVLLNDLRIIFRGGDNLSLSQGFQF